MLGKPVVMEVKRLNMNFDMTEDEFLEYQNDHVGFCVACGAERDCCEPDARNYECESCGEKKVFGLEELLIMGKLEITG